MPRPRDFAHRAGGLVLWPGDPIEYKDAVRKSDSAPHDPCDHRIPDGHKPLGLPSPGGERINPKEIPIDRKDFDDDLHGLDDGFDDIEGLIGGLFEGRPDKAMREKWRIEGLDPGGFGLEGILDEWGIGGGGFFDGHGGGRGLLGDDRGGISSGLELVSDDGSNRDSPTPIEGGLGKGDPLTGNPWGTSESWNPLGVASPIKITEGSVTDASANWWQDKGISITIAFDSGPTPTPAPRPEVPKQRQPEVYKPTPVREKPKSSVEQGVDDPKKPKGGTGVARPDPTRDAVGGLPPSWDRPAWDRLRALEKPKKGTDEGGGWDGSESGGESTRGARGVKVDWELVIGRGHTDPGREGETQSAPRHPKHAGKMKARKPTSDDPSVFGPHGVGKSAPTEGGIK